MENKEIIEGNKLIAEFMGGKYRKGNKKQSIEERYFGLIEKGYYHWVSELRYHKSWDWIMPVVEKIEKLGCIVEISYSLVCMCRICVIGKKYEKAFNITNDNNGGLEPIIAVYKSVVEFIKWYNENKDNGK